MRWNINWPTTPVTVDLLADSYVSTKEGIVLTGASPDFTREQFLAHAQARLNDSLNTYAVTAQTTSSAGGVVDAAKSSALGISSQLFYRAQVRR